MTQIIINETTPIIVEVSTPGPQGSSGTIDVGTVTTGASGSAAAVTNSGTPSAAVFNFTIPKGDVGDVTPAATAAKNAAEAAATAAQASSTAAQSSSTSASASATAALNSANQASASASTASTKAQEATTSANNASNSAQSVLAAANTATTKAQEAATSASNALASANTASTKAQEASASEVISTTKAQEAVVSATTATNAATSASASAASALLSKQVTTDNAALAIAQATIASTKATQAAASEAEALAQAGVATNQAAISTAQAVISSNQASIATTQAAAALVSAQASAASASTSSTQAGISTTQATAASSSASNAALSATAAANAQTAAAASATTATTQATAATAAKTAAETARDAAIVAQNNAVAVVTGGTATLTPQAGKIPLADGLGKIAKGWLTNTDLVEQTDIGTAPNEIPLNQYLGEMAYMDANTIPTIGVATANLATANVTNLMQVTEVSTVMPTLNLDFAKVKQLDPRITFTRASTGTYYDGKTRAKAEENLLLQSQAFETNWIFSDVSIIANATTAPDGTVTADKLVENSVNTAHNLVQAVTTTAASHVFSIYAKASERNFIVLYNLTTVVAQCFDLTTGTVGASTGSPISTITPVGNGWYRCTMVHTATAASNSFRIYLATSNTVSVAYQGDGTSGIFIWGAQLEQRSAATAYTPTTTQPITNYIPVLMTAASGVPRFEHNPVTGESLGLEIEEQRTNLVLQSDGGLNWSTMGTATVTSDTGIAPNGTNSAFTVTGATDVVAPTGGNNIYKISTVLPNVTITFSVYVKAITATTVSINIFDGTTGASSTQSIALTNQWQRIQVTRTPSGSTTIMRYTIGSANGTVLCWGAQAEAGAFPTSYIPTTTAQVTRAADSAVMTGANFSSWYRQDEGTVYIDVANFKSSTTINAALLTLADNPLSSSWVSIYGTTTNILVGRRASGTSGSNLVFAISALSNRVVYSYLSGGTDAASLNGTTPAISASLASYTNTQMLIGGFGSNPNSLNGTIKKITYYPQRLSNAELVEITA